MRGDCAEYEKNGKSFASTDAPVHFSESEAPARPPSTGAREPPPAPVWKHPKSGNACSYSFCLSSPVPYYYYMRGSK